MLTTLGNTFYVVRVVLRCRQLARERFAKLRSDVLVKLELLDQKHGEFGYLNYSLYPPGNMTYRKQQTGFFQMYKIVC